MTVELRTIVIMIPKKTNVHATEKSISRQTGNLITLRLEDFLLSFCFVPVVPVAFI